MIKGMK